MIITINGVDQTSKVIARTFRIEQILTQEADTARLSLLDPDTIPDILQEIIVEDDASNKIFAGVVLNINIKYDSNQAIYELTCKDYTELMDGKYVVDDFTNETVADIIDYIITTYLPSGFTLDCQVSQTISYIKFNYDKASSCFKKLAELVIGDWYVDYDKVIHFIDKSTFASPFSLTDDGNKFIKGSLVIKKDASQIKNTVFVRGGEYLGSNYTETIIADGSQTTFNLAYRYDNISVSVAGVGKTVGIDNIDDPSTVDCLYNFGEKTIKFPSASKPTSGQSVAISGLPYIPVYVRAEEIGSISKYGVKEFKIIDANIKSKQGAIDRAKAELQSYNEALSDGSFSTYETGLRTGQQIGVNSVVLGVNEQFIISKLSIIAESPNLLRFDATLTTLERFDLIGLLQKLLDRTEIGEDRTDEVLEKLYNSYEAISVEESIERMTPMDGSEEMSIGENIRRDPFTIVFVLTPYTVIDENDPNRPFLLDLGLLS